jgi:hypothetical protein
MAFECTGRKFTGGKFKMSSYRIIGTDGGELYHSGTKGQKWGKRLYQYSDGSLTPLGRIHYGVGPSRDESVLARDKQIRANKKTYKESLKKANKRAKEELEKQAKKDAGESEESSKKTTTSSTSSSKKNISEMSNEELDSYITRLQKEKQVKELENAVYGTNINSSENNKKANNGKSFARQIGESAARTILTATVVYTAGGVVNAMAKDNVVKGGKAFNKEKKKNE